MKYKEWLTIWLENYVKPTVKHRTYMRYESIVSNHIIQKLGDYEINELSLLVIQTCITEMINAGNIKNRRRSFGKHSQFNYYNNSKIDKNRIRKQSDNRLYGR